MIPKERIETFKRFLTKNNIDKIDFSQSLHLLRCFSGDKEIPYHISRESLVEIHGCEIVIVWHFRMLLLNIDFQQSIKNNDNVWQKF